MVKIEGLNKAEVLKVLFNNSKIQGFNQQRFEMGLMEYPKDLTTEDAQNILNERIESGFKLYFDYLNGKVMKIDLTSDIEFDEWGYDRDNGEGAAQKAIDLLK